MDKVDLMKQWRDLYQPSAKEVAAVEVPPINFLMVDGIGDPAGPEFQEAMGALYAVAYTIKFARKKAGKGPDYGVMPPEALWWTERGEFDMARRDQWRWTLMIAQPDFISPEEVEEARAEVVRKKNLRSALRVRLERLEEGPAAQIMHVGPYSEEPATIGRLHDFIATQGGTPCGKHHEIYLSDPRRTVPEKMKTVLRQPYAVPEAV